MNNLSPLNVPLLDVRSLGHTEADRDFNATRNIALDPGDLFRFEVKLVLESPATFPNDGLMIFPIGALPPGMELYDKAGAPAHLSTGTKSDPPRLLGAFRPQAYDSGEVYPVTFGILDVVTGLSFPQKVYITVKGPTARTNVVVTTEPGPTFEQPPFENVTRDLILRIKTDRSIQTFPTVFEKKPNSTSFIPISLIADDWRVDGDSFTYKRRFLSTDAAGLYVYRVVTQDYETNQQSSSREVSFYLGMPSEAGRKAIEQLASRGAQAALDALHPSSTGPKIGDRIIAEGDNGLTFTHIFQSGAGLVGPGSSGNFIEGPAYLIDGTEVTLRQFSDTYHILTKGGGNILTKGGGNILTKGGAGILAKGGSNFKSYRLFDNTFGYIAASAISRGAGNIIDANGVVSRGSGTILTKGGAGIVAVGAGGLVQSGLALNQLIAARLISEDTSGFSGIARNGNAIQSIIGSSFNNATSLISRNGADLIGKGGATFGPGSQATETRAPDFTVQMAPAGVATSAGGAAVDATLHANYLLLHASALQVPSVVDSPDITSRIAIAKQDLEIAVNLLDAKNFDGLTAEQNTALQRASALMGFNVAPASGTVFVAGGRIILTPAVAGQTFGSASATAPTDGSFVGLLAGVVATIGGDVPEADQPNLTTTALPIDGHLIELISVAPGRIEAKLPLVLELTKPLLIVLTASDGKLGMAGLVVSTATSVVSPFAPFDGPLDKVIGGRSTAIGGQSLVFINGSPGANESAVRILDPLTGEAIGNFSRPDFGEWTEAQDRTLVGDVDGDGVDEIIQFNRAATSGQTPATGGAIRVLKLTDGSVLRSTNYSDIIVGQSYTQILAGMIDPEDEVFVGHFTQKSNLEAFFFNRTNQADGATSVVVIDLVTGAVTDRGFHNNLNFGGWIDATDEYTISDTNFDGFDDLVIINRVANPESFRATPVGFVGMVSLQAQDSGRNARDANDPNPKGSNIGFYRFFNWNFAKAGEQSVFPGYDEQDDRATFGKVVNNGVLTRVIVLVNSQFDGNPQAAGYALLQPALLVQGVPDSFQLISTQFRSNLPAGSFEPDDLYLLADVSGDESDEFVSYSPDSTEIVLRVFGAFNGQKLSEIGGTGGGGGGSSRPVVIGPSDESFTNVIDRAASIPAGVNVGGDVCLSPAAVDLALATESARRRHAFSQPLDADGSQRI